MKEWIYGLIDPRYPSHVRYVGRTAYPEGRLAIHRSCHDGTARKRAWTLSIRDAGLRPAMIILEEIDPGEDDHSYPAARAEREWIARYLQRGASLLNGRLTRLASLTGEQIVAAMIAADGNQTHAARALGVPGEALSAVVNGFYRHVIPRAPTPEKRADRAATLAKFHAAMDERRIGRARRRAS